VGALGQHHARYYADLAASGVVEFVGVCDQDAGRAEEISAKHGLVALKSAVEVAKVADAISIATPTITHFELARELLGKGRHVLVEKPMTEQAHQAAELVQLAQENNCVLQVGHVERFNPVFDYLPIPSAASILGWSLT
jgi:predicted dehydrogenase